MHKKNLTRLFGVVGLCLAAQVPAMADSGTFNLGTGFDFSSGTYGTSTTTDITSIPVYGLYETGPWTLKLTVPYIRVSGNANVIPGIGPVNNTNPYRRGGYYSQNNVAIAPTSTTAQGLGDIVAAATYNAYNDTASGLGVDLTGRIKFGTADANEGLGTGENDYSTEVDVYKSFGKLTAFGGIGYNVLGSSQYIQLNNVFNSVLGASYTMDEQNSASLSYDAEQKIAASGYPEKEVIGNLVHKINKNWTAQAYVLGGFAYGSPDWGIGASAAYTF